MNDDLLNEILEKLNILVGERTTTLEKLPRIIRREITLSTFLNCISGRMERKLTDLEIAFWMGVYSSITRNALTNDGRFSLIMSELPMEEWIIDQREKSELTNSDPIYHHI